MVCFLYKFPVWNINGGKKRITLKVADVSRELIGDIVNFFLQLLTIVSLVWNIEYSADVGRKLKRRYNLINQVFSTPDWRLFPVWNITKKQNWKIAREKRGILRKNHCWAKELKIVCLVLTASVRQVYTSTLTTRTDVKATFIITNGRLDLVLTIGCFTALWGSCNGEIRLGICHFQDHFKQKWHFHFLTHWVLLKFPL